MSKNGSEITKVGVPEDGIGERIRKLREEKVLTQEALSILTKYPEIDPEGRGLSRPSIVGYEQGKNLPDARGIRLLAMALETTPSFLILGKFDDPAESDDPRQALLDALDRYTARRINELPTAAHLMTAALSGQNRRGKKLEELDSLHRARLEERAKEEAKLETQKRNKTTS